MPLPSELIERLADAGARRELGRLLDALVGAAAFRVERGVWTPTFAGTSTAGAFTYVEQLGHWWRFDSLTLILGRCRISAIGVAPVGSMSLPGLPFRAGPLVSLYGGVDFFAVGSFNYAAGALDLGGYIAPSTDVIRLIESFDNAAAADTPAANFTNASCQLTFFGLYEVG